MSAPQRQPAGAGRQPGQLAQPQVNLQRKPSASSDSSTSSIMSNSKPLPYSHYGATAAASMTNLSNNNLGLRKTSTDLPLRGASPATQTADYHRHKARQHSQGFFEPSLLTTSGGNSNMSTSKIAAAAAMHVQNPQQQQQLHQQPIQHDRRRSQTIPDPSKTLQPTASRKPSNSNPSPAPTIVTQPAGVASTTLPRGPTPGPQPPQTTAASAANAAYPRSPLGSPELPFREHAPSPTSDNQPKSGKEKSRRNIFSRPKNITVSKDKDLDKKSVTIQSPGKASIYSLGQAPWRANQSTTSLTDMNTSSASSLYSNTNASSSTLVPSDRSLAGEKEKHRPHFLSRQRHKNPEHFNLPLSSASSNSRPVDPNAPQSLYSFAPSSPGPGSSFNKSISGLDLRHGGRALREKKKEEKAAASGFVPPVPPISKEAIARDGYSTPTDLIGPPTLGTPTTGSPGGGGAYFQSDFGLSSQNLAGFGLSNMTPDDAWPLLKARLLNLFEGEDLRTPVEDFNRLVFVHLQNCIQRRTPAVIIEDLRELLQTGFSSLDQTLRRVPDDRLVPHLVEMWSFVFGSILPFVQAVFLPLDLELRGHGPLLSARDAGEFWSLVSSTARPTPNIGALPALSVPLNDALDVRTLVLLSFRDFVIIPRHDTLLAIFSRLSLDNINATPVEPLPLVRPGTAASMSSAMDAGTASYTSQGSTLLDSSAATDSFGARSRATSNTSAGSFHSISSQRPPPRSTGPGGSAAGMQMQPIVMDSGKVTQTAARMLQCVSVLAGLQTAGIKSGSGHAAGSSIGSVSEASSASTAGEPVNSADAVAREKIEMLAKELKLNWLGRGRTGRNRRGFVGSRVRNPVVAAG